MRISVLLQGGRLDVHFYFVPQNCVSLPWYSDLMTDSDFNLDINAPLVDGEFLSPSYFLPYLFFWVYNESADDEALYPIKITLHLY